MLNLSIVMFRAFLLFLLFQDPTVSIASPQTGMTLRGQVEILGTMDVPNFASAELAFGFVDAAGIASNPADAWFIIQTFPQPKVDSPLAVWDTTSVTDGDYNLRLRVRLQDGSFQDSVVTGVKIRNDLPEPTVTPTEDLQPISSAVAPPTNVPATPTRAVFVQPTSLPSNPAALKTSQVYATFGRGAFIALGLFVILSFLLRLRKD
jgi:hypothetical protein